MKRKTTLAALAGLMAPIACLAADASHPYQNVDPTVDAGNNTGDDQVEALNQAELDRLPTPSPYVPTGPIAMPYPLAPTYYAPPPVYYPPPQYYPPPPIYYPPAPFSYRAPPAYYPSPGYYPPPAYRPPGW